MDIKKGFAVTISDEAVKDQHLPHNVGIVVRFFDEPLANSEPTPLVEIELDSGNVNVGAHEITELEFCSGEMTSFGLFLGNNLKANKGKTIDELFKAYILTYY